MSIIFLLITILSYSVIIHGHSFFGNLQQRSLTSSKGKQSSSSSSAVQLIVPTHGLYINSKDKAILDTSIQQDEEEPVLQYHPPSVLQTWWTRSKLQWLHFPPFINTLHQQKNMMLKLKLEGNLMLDDGQLGYGSTLLPSCSSESMKVHSLTQLMQIINFAIYDPRIQGICIELGSITNNGYTTLQEMIRLFTYFKSSKKILIGFSDGITVTESEYLLSRSFHEYYLSPISSIQLYGFLQECSFYTLLLQRIGIDYQSFNIGEYKGYGNQYTSTSISTKSREIYSTLLYQQSQYWLQTVASSLNITTRQLQENTWNRKIPFTMTEYLQHGMITGILYPDQVMTLLTNRFRLTPSKIPPILVMVFTGKWLHRVWKQFTSVSFTWKQLSFLWIHKESIMKLGMFVSVLTWKEKWLLFQGSVNVLRLVGYGQQMMGKYHLIANTNTTTTAMSSSMTANTTSTSLNNSTNTTTNKPYHLRRLRYSLSKDYEEYPQRKLNIYNHPDTTSTTMDAIDTTDVNELTAALDSIKQFVSHRPDKKKIGKIVKDWIKTHISNLKTCCQAMSRHCHHFFSCQLPELIVSTTLTMKKHVTSFLDASHNITLESIQSKLLYEYHFLKNTTIPALLTHSQDCMKNITHVFHAFHQDIQEIIKTEHTYPLEFIPAVMYLSSLYPLKHHYFTGLPFQLVSSGPRIAVIDVSGTIVNHHHLSPNPDEMSSRQSITVSSFTHALQNAIHDPQIKAIVLRIDSPGGDMIASDQLWRQIRLAGQMKPIIASMGNVCASGGYYLAMACDHIIAEEHTITGSIGIGYYRVNIGKFLKKLLINKEFISIGRYAEMGYSTLKQLTNQEAKVIQVEAETNYHMFVKKAAKSRNMTYDAMHQLAKGKVWTGKQAYQIGLIDDIGGIWKAVQRAIQFLPMEEQTLFFPKIQQPGGKGGKGCYKVEFISKSNQLLSLIMRNVQYEGGGDTNTIPNQQQQQSSFSKIKSFLHVPKISSPRRSLPSSHRFSVPSSSSSPVHQNNNNAIIGLNDMIQDMLPISLPTLWTWSSLLHFQSSPSSL